jgi:hypothetical protein
MNKYAIKSIRTTTKRKTVEKVKNLHFILGSSLFGFSSINIIEIKYLENLVCGFKKDAF